MLNRNTRAPIACQERIEFRAREEAFLPLDNISELRGMVDLRGRTCSSAGIITEGTPNAAQLVY